MYTCMNNLESSLKYFYILSSSQVNWTSKINVTLNHPSIIKISLDRPILAKEMGYAKKYPHQKYL